MLSKREIGGAIIADEAMSACKRNGFRSLAPVLILALLCLIEAPAIAQEIRDGHNRLVYRVNSDGEIWTPRNKLVARIGVDGRVRSSQNILLLRLDDGKVYSPRNK